MGPANSLGVRTAMEQRADDAARATNLAWRLRDMRNAGIGLVVWPLDWTLDYVWSADGVSACFELHVGPFVLTLDMNALTGPFGLTPREILERRGADPDRDLGIG